MTLIRVEQFLWRLALLVLPLGTIWMFRFGNIGEIPWAMGNIGIGLGELLITCALLSSIALRGIHVRPKVLVITLAFLGVLIGRALVAPEPLVAIMMIVSYTLAFLVLAIEFPFVQSEARTWIALGLVTPFIAAFLQVFVWEMVPASTLLGMSGHALMAPGTSVIDVNGERFLRAYGTFAHPNIFGAYLVIAIALLAHGSERWMKYILALCGFMLAITFSRAAMLAVIAILVFKKNFVVPALTGVLVGILLFLPAYGVRIGAHEGRLEKISAEERASSLSDGWKLFISAPLVGVGVMQSVPTLTSWNPSEPVWSFEPAHLVPSLMLAEWGVIGTLLSIFLLIIWMRGFVVEPKHRNRAIFATIIVLGLFDHALLTSVPLVLLAAIAVRVSYVEK